MGRARRTSGSAPAHPPLHVHVLRDPLLVRLIPLPRDVAIVMSRDQDGPLVLRNGDPPAPSRPAVHDRGLRAGLPERVGACIDGVGEDVVHRVVDRELPDHASAERSGLDGRQLHSFLPEP